MDVVQELLARLTEVIDGLSALVVDSPLTYVIILVMAGVDVLFPVLPAEATITAAAVLAGQGSLNIVWVMLAAAVGAFLGDNVAYWVGRTAGRPLVRRVLRGNTAQLEAVAEQFERRGGTFIILGRFVPGGRTAVAIGAGVLHFGWGQFILYDAVAVVVWAFQAALPGYIGGSLIQDRPWLALVFGFALSALLAVGIALVQRWRGGRRGSDVPVRPAVVGIGSADAALEVHEHASIGPAVDVPGADTEERARPGER